MIIFAGVLSIIFLGENDSAEKKTTEIKIEDKLDFMYTSNVKYKDNDNDYKAGGTFNIDKKLKNSCEVEVEIEGGSLILTIFQYDDANGKKSDDFVREELIKESGKFEFDLDYLEEKTYWIELGRSEEKTTASATLRFIQTK